MSKNIQDIFDSLPEDKKNEIMDRALKLQSKFSTSLKKLLNMNTKLQQCIEEAPSKSFSDQEEKEEDNVEWSQSRECYFEQLYNYVFSENFSKWIFSNFPSFLDYWYDPDTSYTEDVECFARALKQYINSLNVKNDIQTYLSMMFSD